ncbi:hypothetical protein BH11PSE9_BH11PSE9_20490 [soil metagenome]
MALVPRAPQKRNRRRQLPALLRYLIIAATGTLVAVFAGYLLRSIGF